jgi:phenylalanyl-tRNA synthetase alpha chain
MRSLPEVDVKVLTALAARSEPIAIQELALELGIDQSKVTAACQALAETGQLEIVERIEKELRLGAKARQYPGGELPEAVIARAHAGAPGKSVPIAELGPSAGLDKKLAGEAIRQLEQTGWARKEKGALVFDVTEAQIAGSAANAITKISFQRGPERWIPEAELARAVNEALGTEAGYETARQELKARSGILDEKERKARMVTLTALGREIVKEGIAPRGQVNQLTSELLLSGEWADVDLRPYDVKLEAEPVFPGKEHPLVSVFSRTRRVFLEMGFEEIVSSYVESSFWDFDALFQPQDHPAREMQDTFYIARPSECRLPDDSIVERVRRTHEDGGETGSVGWRYRWNPEIARRPVLRTHTTASTIRALAQDPRSPRKVFCVGPVFRRETVDYKHLPVFHQVDGVIIDERASFATLLGTLAAFYRKMGFERFQFRPGFFPYTEPSVEVFVWLEKKHDWVEMGGAGMFRPEVTEPFGCKSPVLAWGLGLERLAMFRYDLSSIGELYRARLPFLKETPLCR